MSNNYSYTIIEKTKYCLQEYPYLHLQQDDGISQVSPIHCRSFVVGQHADGRYVISKGNGLAYSQYPFLYTREQQKEILGLLLKEDALRDFHCGQDVRALGIKTNLMECVIEVDYPIFIRLLNKELKPILLQYSVECPWRIADAGFMTQDQIWAEVAKWERMNDKCFKDEYLIAANVLIRNLRTLHDNGVLHNALTYENLTWALELLDFELCHTPQHPYSEEDYLRHVPKLFDREVIDTYRLINFIAGVLHQPVDYKIVDNLFLEYGFDLAKFKV